MRPPSWGGGPPILRPRSTARGVAGATAARGLIAGGIGDAARPDVHPGQCALMDLRDDLQAAALGAASGVVATGAMSAIMLAAQRAGIMSELPPHDIADDTVNRTAARDDVDQGGRDALGWIFHFVFGAASGAMFAVVRRVVRLPGPAALHGIPYALGIWAVSYLGWVPALGFLPPATRDEPGRPPTMILAHVVFGAITGALLERLGRRTRSPRTS